jgi:hypothetical protein
MFLNGWDNETKTIDNSKPMKYELKCKKSRKDNKYHMETVFHGGKNVKKDPKKLIGSSGAGEWRICCEWLGAYYGTHGDKEYGSSVTNKIKEANVKVRDPYSRGVTKQLLPVNDAPAEEDEEFDDPTGEPPEPVNEDDFDEEPTDPPEEPPKKKASKKKGPVEKKKAKKPTAAEKRRIARQKQKQEESESESESDE